MSIEYPALQPIDDDLDVPAILDELEMTEADLDAGLESGGDLGLRDLFEPPNDFATTIAKRAERKLADREALETFAGLAALPWMTLRLLIGDGIDDEL